jgi:hypothetical protein
MATIKTGCGMRCMNIENDQHPSNQDNKPATSCPFHSSGQAKLPRSTQIGQLDDEIISAIHSKDLCLGPSDNWAQRYREYKLLREHAPVYYDQSSKTWYVTRYEDVIACGKNRALDLTRIVPQKFDALPNEEKAVVEPITNSLSRWMIYNAGPTHA